MILDIVHNNLIPPLLVCLALKIKNVLEQKENAQNWWFVTYFHNKYSISCYKRVIIMFLKTECFSYCEGNKDWLRNTLEVLRGVKQQ